MFLVIVKKGSRKSSGLFMALLLLTGIFGLAPGVRAQTPPVQQAKAPADFLSYAGDILPQRQRDLFVMRADGTDKKQLTHRVQRLVRLVGSRGQPAGGDHRGVPTIHPQRRRLRSEAGSERGLFASVLVARRALHRLRGRREVQHAHRQG